MTDGASSSAGKTDLERASNVDYVNEPLKGTASTGDNDVEVNDDDDDGRGRDRASRRPVIDDDEQDETDADSRSERTSTGSMAKAVVHASVKRRSAPCICIQRAAAPPYRLGLARAFHHAGACPFASRSQTVVGYPVGLYSHPHAFAQHAPSAIGYPAAQPVCYVNPCAGMRPVLHQQVAYVLVHRPAFEGAAT